MPEGRVPQVFGVREGVLGGLGASFYARSGGQRPPDFGNQIFFEVGGRDLSG
jgi:hypothetical protein